MSVINIDETTIKEMIGKEIKEQVAKFIKSKTMEQMVKQEIVNGVCNVNTIAILSESLIINNPCVRNAISEQVARKMYDSMLDAMKPSEDEYEYE